VKYPLSILGIFKVFLRKINQKSMKNIVKSFLILLVSWSCTSVKIKTSELKKPNIICILMDDMGFSDISCYGGEIKTPSIDRLANEGVRLSGVYNGGMCVLSRTSLLSGKWWPRAGAGIKNGQNVAQELQKQGYKTGLVGKWHLQGEPNDKGFDYFFGFLSGFSSYFDGSKDYRLNKTPFTDFGKNYYSTDAFTDRAIEFIKPNKDENKPFFLYLSYQAPHNPLQAGKEDIMKYRGKYLGGWQAIRDVRIKNQIKMGILEEGTNLPDYPKNLPDWNTLTPEQKDLEDLRMAVYAAMLEKVDNGIGKLMENLKTNGQLDNTFILFLSDNGRDPFSSTDAAMLKMGKLPGDANSNWQVGMGWAYAGNTPWRMYKISQHNGGVRTGAIAWCPSLIKQAGAIQANPMHLVDIMPTFLEMASGGKKYKTTDEIAGQSFLPLLKGEKWDRKTPMFFQHMDNRAIRTDAWSLIEVDDNGWELYRKEDVLERTDVAKQNPKIVAELEKMWLNWWFTEGGKDSYIPETTKVGPHYKPQGDRGSGKMYEPTAMPAALSDRYKINH
jgi:arylsulfatase A-like enzyme